MSAPKWTPEVMVWDWGGEPLNAQTAIDQARAALAKARGEQA